MFIKHVDSRAPTPEILIQQVLGRGPQVILMRMIQTTHEKFLTKATIPCMACIILNSQELLGSRKQILLATRDSKQPGIRLENNTGYLLRWDVVLERDISKKFCVQELEIKKLLPSRLIVNQGPDHLATISIGLLGSPMCLFPTASVKNYNKLTGLKSKTLYNLADLEVQSLIWVSLGQN